MARGLVLAFVVLLCAGCSTYRPEPPSRLNPAGTIESLKKSAREKDYAGEWDILSPDFKTRLSDRVGRAVDVSDYEQARRGKASDPEVRRVERLLQIAETHRVVMHSPTRATAEIGGPMGQGGTYEVGMSRVDLWELRIADDPEPYSGIVGDPLTEAIPEEGGAYTFVMRDLDGNETMRQMFPAEMIEGYVVVTKWYVDDLGEFESDLLGEINADPQ